jgi:phosphoglycolate phosphatase-like HAD superfamily hydrolase
VRADFKTAVATSKNRAETIPLLHKIQLAKYFDIIMGTGEGIREKPHADMVEYILAEARVMPEKAILLGDTPIDVRTARNAGMSVGVVTTGAGFGFTTVEELHAAAPDFIVPSLKEALRFLY